MNPNIIKIMKSIADIIVAVFLIHFWFRYLDLLPELAPLSTYQLGPLVIYVATAIRIVSYFFED